MFLLGPRRSHCRCRPSLPPTFWQFSDGGGTLSVGTDIDAHHTNRYNFHGENAKTGKKLRGLADLTATLTRRAVASPPELILHDLPSRQIGRGALRRYRLECVLPHVSAFPFSSLSFISPQHGGIINCSSSLFFSFLFFFFLSCKFLLILPCSWCRNRLSVSTRRE